MLFFDFSQYCTDEDWLSEIPLQLKKPTLSDWEKAIYLFLQEWFSPTDRIEVQTSGSTGEPKVLHVSKQMMRVSASKTLHFLQLKPEETALLCLSANYIAGKMMIVRAIIGGLKLYAIEPTSAPLRHSELNTQSPVCFDFSAMVPVQVFEEMNNNFSLNKIKKLLIGGGAVSADLENKLQSLSCICYETYGMTETVSHIALRQLNGNNKQAFFSPMDDISVSTDKRGCIIISAPGLLDNPLHTNDLAIITENGQFRITGRIDNIINCGGVKIQPEAIEQKIGLFFKKPFLISSIKNKKWGESLVLVSEEKMENDILSKINKLLPPSQQIHHCTTLTEIPQTSSSKKIDRKNVNLLIENIKF